jgi:hypothetical protein
VRLAYCHPAGFVHVVQGSLTPCQSQKQHTMSNQVLATKLAPNNYCVLTGATILNTPAQALQWSRVQYFIINGVFLFLVQRFISYGIISILVVPCICNNGSRSATTKAS